jgi:hypothetical protein
MPNRVLQGEPLWQSDKLNLVQPLDYRAEFANMLPLATSTGTFECEPRRVWLSVYAFNRPDISQEKVELMLAEYERVKMLYRWMHTDGKEYGFWVGINKRGRLPSPAHVNYEKHGPRVPKMGLEKYLNLKSPGNSPMTSTGNLPIEAPDTPDNKKTVSLSPLESFSYKQPQGSPLGYPSPNIGVPNPLPGSSTENPLNGLGLGKDKGLGKGLGVWGNEGINRGKTGEVEEVLPVYFSLSRNEENPEPEKSGDEGSTDQRETAQLVVNPATKEKNPSAKESGSEKATGERNPAPEKRSAIEDKNPTTVKRDPPLNRINPAGPNQQPAQPTLYRELHPPRVTAEDWDPLDYAFTRTDAIDEVPPREIRRTVYYHFRESSKEYWKSKAANVSSPARFEKAIKAMTNQVPPDYSMSGVMTTHVLVHDPGCCLCGGSGYKRVPHPAYARMPSLHYEMDTHCSCMVQHPAPWRIIKPEAVAE